MPVETLDPTSMGSSLSGAAAADVPASHASYRPLSAIAAASVPISDALRKTSPADATAVQDSAVAVTHSSGSSRALSKASSCPFERRFFVHYDTREADQFWYHCHGESFFCTAPFVDSILQHPCRTRKLTSETPILVANAMHRALDINLMEESFRYSMRVLRRLPPNIMNHKHVYLLAGGEMWMYGAYEGSLPPGATIFSQVPCIGRAPTGISPTALPS